MPRHGKKHSMTRRLYLDEHPTSIRKECSLASLPSLHPAGGDRRKVKLTILLFLLLMTVLVVEEFATPFVITVYSKGCWSVVTGGVFQRFNVQGCGSGTWVTVDLYASVHSQPVPGGTNDVSVVVTNGAGPGGGCIGGSVCRMLNLWFYGPPSPIKCQGCVFTPAGSPNPGGDWLGGGLSTLPLFTIVLLVYLASSFRRAPRIYRSYLKGEREPVSWRNLSEGEKALTIFALGYVGFRSYQFIATMLHLYVSPVPTLGFPFGEFVSFLAVIWLMHYVGWKFPLKASSPNVMAAIPGGGGDPTSYPQPASTGPLRTRASDHRTLILVFILLALIVAGIIVPQNYASIQAFSAPKPNIKIVANPSTFTALPGAIANTTILVTGLKGAAGKVSLTVDQYPSCNGACTVPLLQVTLSRNLLSTSPGQTATSSFIVDPVTFADPGSYDFLVKATPDTGPAISTIVTVHLAGFNLTANPSILSFARTSWTRSTVTVNSFYGYSGNVRLWASTDAIGPVGSLSERNVTLPAWGSTTTSLNVTSQAQGNYQVEVSALSGRLFQTIFLPTATSPTSSAADFSLTVIPNSANVNPGQKENVIIEVSSVNDCICIVHLYVKGEISSEGPDPLIVTVSPNQSANSTLILDVGQFSSPGRITVAVTGVSGAIVHWMDIVLNVT
jgi:hypothetical protein